MAKKGAGIYNRNPNMGCSFGDIPGSLHIGATGGGLRIVKVPLTIKVRVIRNDRLLLSPLEGIRVEDLR